MKKILSLILGCSLLLVTTSPVIATEKINNNTVKIGYVIETADAKGVDIEKGTDFVAEYFKEVGKFTGRDYDVIHCDMDEARVMLNSGEIDVIGPLNKTHDAINRFLFIEKEFGQEEVFLATLPRDPMQSGDFDAMSSATIGVAAGDQHQESFDLFLERNQMDPTVYEILQGNNTLPEKYSVELTSAFRLNAERNVVMELGESPYYFAVKNGSDGLKAELDEAMSMLSEKEPEFSEVLYEKYYGGIKRAPEYIASGDELEGYKEEYVIAYSDKHPPFMYSDKNGEAQGVSVEMLNQIAEILGIRVSYVELDDVKGEADLNLSIMKGEQLDYAGVYSRNYLEVPMMMVGDVSLQYNQGVRAGYLDYYSMTDEDLGYLFYDATFKKYDSYERMRKAYLAGELDFIIAGNVVLVNDMDEFSEMGDVSIVPIHINVEPKIAFSNKLSSHFIDSVNSAIGRMDTGIVNSYILKGVQGEGVDFGLSQLWKEYKEGILIIVMTIILIIIGIIFSGAHERKRKLVAYLHVDMVTGLESEKKILESITKAIEEKEKKSAILTIDIDNYKYINNTYGYEIGTEILVEFANYLKQKVEDSHIARVFADQFLLLLDESKVDYVVALLQEDDELAELFSNRLGEGYNLSLSMGVYHITGDEQFATNAVDSANIARGASKKAYGRVTTVFSAKMAKEMASRNMVVQRMRQGIENKEFYMMYQPKLELETERVIGAEALVRWNSEGVSIYPDQFIPIFEENGFITQLDYYVLENVCGFIKENPTVPCIAVNLSGITLLEEDVLSRIASILARYEVATDKIQLEVTESAVIKDYARAVKQIGKLRNEGFQIALDDFGAGESSLNRLKDFLIDVLKLDKEFLGKTLINIKGVYIIEYVIKLAKKLDLKIVAEGVETREQADILKVLGCDIAQGYLFAKPMMEDEFLRKIEDEK